MSKRERDDAEAVALISSFEANWEYITTQRDELEKNHRGEWMLVHNNDQVVLSNDVRSALDDLKETGVDTRSVAYFRLGAPRTIQEALSPKP